MNRLKFIIPLVGVILLNQGCAAILSGKTQQVTFQSERKATVTMNMREIGETNEPIRIMKSDFSKLYTIELEGCEIEHVELPISENGLAFIDAFFCGLSLGTFCWPLAIDYATSSNLQTNPVIDVTLNCTD